MPPPQIPPRLASLLTSADQESIALLGKRSVSALTAFSTLYSASSIPDFINAKIESLTADIAVSDRVKGALIDTKKRKTISDEEYRDTIEKVDAESIEKERELVSIKRQKKLIIDDVEEILPKYETIEDAYIETMTTRVMAASSNQRMGPTFDRRAFSRVVLDYYGAKREKNGATQNYCHILGWTSEKDVKCAHIVPKSMQSDELSYLFGVREAILSEPKNGITLHRTIEEGLDNGNIVFVPDSPVLGAEITWRCILINRSRAADELTVKTKWRDIDGKELEFLTPNRPARRYLYLRYLITCIHQKRMGNSAWLDEALARTDVRGYMWATPGPYLRKSMLMTLAQKMSDNFLPEAFYSQATFDEADGCPSRSAEEEEDLALGLDLGMKDVFVDAKEDLEDTEDEE